MRMAERRLHSLLMGAYPAERAVTYGVKIDKTISDPAAAVTYTDDAAGFLPSSGNSGSHRDNGWSGRFPFNRLHPCVLRNGSVQYYLNPNDFRKKRSGRSGNTGSGGDGDVMIEFPKIWYSITQDSRYLYVRYSNYARSGFTDYGMSYKGVVRERFYIGAYLGFLQDGLLRSIINVLPTYSASIGAFRTAAQTMGAGYEILPWNKLILLQILYLVRYKSLNAQSALGLGLTGSAMVTYTGQTDALGMDFGSSSSTQMKFCGMEDFYGNMGQMIDGIILNANGLGGATTGMVATAAGNFNDTGTGYTAVTPGYSAAAGYMTSAAGTDTLGFFPLAAGGSAETYFSDYTLLQNTSLLRFPQFGGIFNAQGQAGPFSVRFNFTASSGVAYVSARLCFLG